MAHTIRLSYGGSPYNLNSGSITLRNYVPKTPNISTIDTNTILNDGGKRTITTRRNVTENCVVLVKPSSGAASDIQDAKHTIQEWLLNAEKYNESENGSKVYVEYAPDGLSSSVYRSELLGGKVSISDNSLDTRWTQSRAVELSIDWTRRHFWEGDEITLTLENSGCTATTATVINQNPLDYTGQSGCYNNWVQIAGSSVAGEVKTPATIEIYNYTGSISSPEYHLFHGYGENITSFPTTIEGEDSSGYQGASTATGACYSGGSYLDHDLPYVITWNGMLRYSLPSGSLQKWNGRYCNIMCGFVAEPSINSNMYVRAELRDSTELVQIEIGAAKRLSAYKEVQTFGTIQMPPKNFTPGDTLDGLYLGIYAKNYVNAAAEDMFIDCLYVFPTDGYRYIKQRGFRSQIDDYVVDDGANDKCTFYDSAGNTMSIMTWVGNPINIIPGEDQRIWLLHSDSADYDPFREHNIIVKYRPRRLTI